MTLTTATLLTPGAATPADVLGQLTRVDDNSFDLATDSLSAGTHLLTVTAQDEVGNNVVTGYAETAQEFVFEFTVEYYEVPVADFSSLPTSGGAPLEVTFTDSSTGNPTGWSWDFDGDGIEDSTDQNPIHTYASVGAYTVSLTVTNPAGSDTEIKTAYISVYELPEADFSAAPLSGIAPLEVEFSDLSTGDIESWEWDFGDGGTSTERNPSHIYTAAGDYTVKLTVSGPGGSDTERKIGFIRATPVAVPSVTYIGAAALAGFLLVLLIWRVRRRYLAT